MPLYHFNLEDGTGLLPDEEGRELPDLEAARAESIKGARSIIAADVLEGRVDLRARIEIADEAGTTLLAVPFAEVIEITT
jgi:hypothetical protein